MTLLQRQPLPPADLPPPCDACGQTGTYTETAVIAGTPIVRCVNPTDCRHHWTREQP